MCSSDLIPASALYSSSQARAVLAWQEAKGTKYEDVLKGEMDSVLRGVALSYDREKKRKAATEKLKNELGIKELDVGSVTVITSKDTQYGKWGGMSGEAFKGVPEKYKDKPVQVIVGIGPEGSDGLAVLGDVASGGKMGYEAVLIRNEKKWAANKEALATLRAKNFVFISGGSSDSCSNTWSKSSAKVSYYELGNNQRFPAVVPFDLQNGWYAWVRNSGGGIGSDFVKGYEASGDVNNLYVCNIGDNGLMETGNGDDLCQNGHKHTIGAIGKSISCPKLDFDDLYEKARRAIQEAQDKYKTKGRINILGNDIEIGRPSGANNGVECQDFMSPEDCLLMFNVCDPVICPPSRCDFGGKFPVSDVIQTGIIGSLVLCAPNAKEGIKIPICLSGVHAGLDSYLSILKSEKQCLEHSLETGELVGICDQITSIYKCEFFWRQLSPLMDQLVPGIIDYAVTGGRVRGGGEYALVSESWNTMKKSASYFKDVYAQNAFRAFNIRSTQEIGSTVCKAFVGSSVPGSASFIEDLLKPESPSQFYAQFSEKLFTEATVPSTSQYKVYFHISAGNDQGVQYKVYLKNPPATSYYASTPEVSVKSGYIAAGSAADESVDFTAPSGYKELCVVINARKECGFKQVTSSFGLDFISKKYTEDQVEDKDIRTEKQCISGSPSSLSMAQLNLQSGAEEMMNPEISLRGIVRVCATENPDAGVVSEDYVVCGKTKDCSKGFECDADLGRCVDKAKTGAFERSGSRWKDVGYCGDSRLRCWLDVNSVKDDLEALETFTGGSYDALNQARGLIDGGRCNLECVAKLLAKARGDISQLAVSSRESVVEKGEKIVADLDNVTGTDKKAGAGTNGDRAEALSLKASVWRLLSLLGVEGWVEKKKDKRPVVDVEDLSLNCAEFCAGTHDDSSDEGLDKSKCEDKSNGYYRTDECCCFDNSNVIDVEPVIKETEEIKEIKNYIVESEGKKNSVYEISGVKHIGIGHEVTIEDRKVFGELFKCDEICFNKLTKGEGSLTSVQVEELFDRDIVIYVDRTIGLFPNYDSYPVYVKMALVSAVYRGEMKDTHKTVKLINADLSEGGGVIEGYSVGNERERWLAVSLEYLKRDDYENAIENNLGGIKIRMDANAKMFLCYSEGKEECE